MTGAVVRAKKFWQPKSIELILDTSPETYTFHAHRPEQRIVSGTVELKKLAVEECPDATLRQATPLLQGGACPSGQATRCSLRERTMPHAGTGSRQIKEY